MSEIKNIQLPDIGDFDEVEVIEIFGISIEALSLSKVIMLSSADNSSPALTKTSITSTSSKSMIA
jgi:hypothetical protein